ncbi:unnamed protein product, partial [Rotaria magnacalcarata]
MDSNEHSNRLNTEFISLVEKINTLSNRACSSEQPFLDALEQWRIESQQTLDSFCNEQRQTFINSRLEELNRLRTNVEELACVQDATQQNTNSIKTSIDWIEQDINNIR